jgi:MYXO-CTERM domain-containing protein
VTPTHFGSYFYNRFTSIVSSENYQRLWNCHVKDITPGMTFPLNGGAGDLVMNDAGDSYDLTSELIGGQIFTLDAVPEPRGWCAFAALGLAAFASIRQRR